jgi:hypothetical protein
MTSLARAVEARGDLGWERHFMALNAPLAGIGFSKIVDFAASKEIEKTDIEFLPHEYWSSFCDKHTKYIRAFFDYRVFVTESEVIELMHKAKYYDQHVREAQLKLREHPLPVSISNNRTPVELIVPFSGDLIVEQLLDVVRTKLGISLDWANFPDLRTSCGPSLSLSVDQVAQPLTLKLSELSHEQLSKLQLWITLLWRDELGNDGDHYDGSIHFHLYRLDPSDGTRPASKKERGEMTLKRMDSVIQSSIWRSLVGT